MSDENRDQSLDPEDWTSLRALAHRAVDDAFDHLVSVRDRPIWQVTPEPIVAKFQQPLPREPQGADAAYRDFREWVMPYPMGNTHPRFWSWYMGGGTAFGALGDFLAAMLNPNVGGGNHVANHVEAQVVDWCKDIVGLPREAGGLLVSGGSMANLIGLAVARNATAGSRPAQRGRAGLWRHARPTTRRAKCTAACRSRSRYWVSAPWRCARCRSTPPIASTSAPWSACWRPIAPRVSSRVA
jgi:hypothetical protein